MSIDDPEKEPPPRKSEDDEATTEVLRRSIDRGETGDKVDFPDPAAAPLGTDAEAGGQMPDDAEMSRAGSGEENPVPRPNDTNNPSGMPVWIMAGFVVVIALALWAVLGWA